MRNAGVKCAVLAAVLAFALGMWGTAGAQPQDRSGGLNRLIGVDLAVTLAEKAVRLWAAGPVP